MSDILKSKGKLKILRDSFVDRYVTHSMTTRDTKSGIVHNYQHFNAGGGGGGGGK